MTQLMDEIASEIAERTPARWWSEATARENDAWLRDLFNTDATLADDYMRARIAYPSLARLDLTNLVIHAEGVIEHFAADGLTRPDYLRAVAAEPWLANQKSATVIENLEGVMNHFAGDGLTRRQYLQAALDQTILFVAPPEAIIGNMEAAADHLAATQSTPRSECLCRAVDRPRLFSQGIESIHPSNSGSSIGTVNSIQAVPNVSQPTSLVTATRCHELTPCGITPGWLR